MIPKKNLDDQKKMLAIEKIRLLLASHHRNALLFEMLIQTTATVPELLGLKVADMNPLSVGDPLPLPADKRGSRTVVFSTAMKRSYERLMAETRPHGDDFLFRSKKGRQPLSQTSVSRLVRGWIEACGLNGFKGIRELRSCLSSGNKSVIGPQKSQTAHQLPKIEALTRQERVFQELEKAIISGQIPPGQKLVTEEIARQMGVSRIPVREAMGRLEARGFITTRPKWGSVVNELSRENLKEILDLRLILECEAIAKAAPHVNENTILELERAHIEFAKARAQNDANQLLLANRRFHLLAYKDSDSPVLLDLINQLWDRVSPYYHIMFRQSLAPHPTVGVDYHDHIVDAMRNHDSEKAKHWIKADLIRSAEFVLELFDLHQQKRTFE